MPFIPKISGLILKFKFSDCIHSEVFIAWLCVCVAEVVMKKLMAFIIYGCAYSYGMEIHPDESKSVVSQELTYTVYYGAEGEARIFTFDELTRP
jgi:hypothetical protein